MLPENDGLNLKIEDEDIEEQVSKTYKLDWETGKISGYVDGIDAVKQAVYKYLNTERYNYLMHTDDFGIELQDLIGEEHPYAIPELERRIREALVDFDSRIEGVSDFDFEVDKNIVYVEFVVSTIYGEFTQEIEVNL